MNTVATLQGESKEESLHKAACVTGNAKDTERYHNKTKHFPPFEKMTAENQG